MPPLKKFAKPLPLAALPRGFAGAGATCGIKPSGKPDLALFASDRPAAAAVVATQNRFAAAPIHVTREHAKAGRARAFIVDAGNANAATGKRGLADARQMCALAAVALGVRPREVLVNSTGVIGVPLPMDRIAHGIPDLAARLCPAGLNDASEAFLTTDKAPKRTARRWAQGRQTVRLAVMVKGVGMIHPDMATMIGAVLTDAAIAPALLRRALRSAVGESFNCLTVDGDTSTNDMVVALANGASGASRIERVNSTAFRRLEEAMTAACQDMTRAMAADGEGASRVAVIHVRGARTPAEARQIARAVGTSNLFKAAMHGADPNWGRIAMAMGNAGVDFDPEGVSVRMAGTVLLRRGRPTPFSAAQVSRAMRRDEVPVEITLGLGRGEARCWSSSLTEEYVRFNAAYTT